MEKCPGKYHMGDFHSQPQLWASSISADLRLPLSNIMPQSSDLNRFEWCLRWCTQPLLFALWDQSVLHCTSFMALSTRRLVAPSVNLHICGQTPLAHIGPSSSKLPWNSVSAWCYVYFIYLWVYISAIGFHRFCRQKKEVNNHGMAETNGTIDWIVFCGGWPLWVA